MEGPLMASYFVIVYAGSAHPLYVRSIGPFPTVDDAERAREREGLGVRPGEREWATVIPEPTSDAETD
jgi:hypothetical protein